MKILYHHRVASKDGQYVHIDEIIKCFRAAGHTVKLVCPDASKVSIGGVVPGVSKLRDNLPNSLSEFLEFGYSAYDFLKLVLAILRERPDFIYERYNIFLPSGVLAKKLFRIPLLLEVNAPLYEERRQHSGLALGALARWSEIYTWCGADFVLPVTNVLADIVVDSGVKRSNVHVIPNGVDPQKFHLPIASGHSVENRADTDPIIIGFVGFVREWHGIDRVIKVLAAASDIHWKLVVIGEGPAKDSLLQLSATLKCTDKVSMLGLIERDQIAEHVAAFDIALQPDVVEYASPLKLIEYMAMARPIIAVDRANIRELLTHNVDAYLISPDDDTALERAIKKLCTAHDLRQRLARGALETVKRRRLYWSENAARIVEIALTKVKQ